MEKKFYQVVETKTTEYQFEATEDEAKKVFDEIQNGEIDFQFDIVLKNENEPNVILIEENFHLESGGQVIAE